jgi:hypothetical protein
VFTVHASHGIQMLADSVKELIEIRLSLIPVGRSNSPTNLLIIKGFY